MFLSKLIQNYIPEIFSTVHGRTKPSMVSVNITDKCNQNCIYCEINKNGSNSVSENKLLTKDDIFWIIDEMSEKKLKKLSINGGEPFLFNEIGEIISYAWSKRIRTNITSNGMNLHQMEKSFFELLHDCRATINISVDSFQNQIQTKTRGNKYALRNAVESIKVLQHYRIPVKMLTAISIYNFHNLFDSLKIAYDIGIKEVLYQPIIYNSNFPDKQSIEMKNTLNVKGNDLEKLNLELKKIYNFEKRHNINTNVYRLQPWINQYLNTASGIGERMFFYDVLNKFHCREMEAVIDISYSGGIQPCGLLPAKKNIKEDDRNTGLLTLWKQSGAELRKNLMMNQFPLACNGCCHKFGRNMISSLMKFPYANRFLLLQVFLLMQERIWFKLYKKFFVY